ncbi:sporulation phosphorelay system protein KapB [Macrococcus carouselicus]|uniref:Kinase n=1 Tax=Macrococcus carouselicus TaxID=69969 RepID=A0A9Q8FQ84_9STAP|nr:sporulation phosphorelay system protein KapB [Macrococcus carouselicus]TDM03757.1 kinase [Macrococcus carouselicus]
MYYQLPFKTGRYVVEQLGDHPNGTLVQVLAVIHHPKQGDLHAPDESPVFFHERKALAYREKRIVHPNLLKPFDEELPHYNESLKAAVLRLEEKLQAEDTDYNRQARRALSNLKDEYHRYHSIQF